ncbi:unnamed protein product [Ectocarpus sp. CCAP 1310/34]|nr:unnamed protein product [Ectocarpus sp. CCAP 1310/34]
MKRGLGTVLRGSSPSTRGYRPPPPLVPGATAAGSNGAKSSSVGSHHPRRLLGGGQLSQQQQLSSSQRHQQLGCVSSLSLDECHAGGVRESHLAQAKLQALAGQGSVAARGRRGSGRGFAPPLRGAAAAAAAVAAVAVAAGSGGKEADCDYPQGTKFGDVYFCSGKALGSGSFGTVCTAQHRTTGKVVAVKRIPRTRTPDFTFAEICWEVEVLKLAGEHRNVTQFHDIFEDDDYYYLTMELARGGELFDLLVDSGPPDEVHTATLMNSLVEAVAFIHLNGIIHGDIKPENVFLTNSSTGDVDWEGIRLGDFGSAVEMVLGGGTTLSGMYTRGTVAYNPPESLRRMLDGKDVVVTTMGDVWALGVVLFMLLTGEHPFTPDMSISDEEMAKRVLGMCDGRYGEAALFPDAEEDEEGGGGARSRVSPLARDLILKMLTPDPELRATPQEVLQHPWLELASLRGGDRTLRTMNPRCHMHRHRTERHPRYGEPTPTNAEALQNFWSARRRLKACMLALMCGLVETEVEGYNEGEGLRTMMETNLKMDERGIKWGAPPPPPAGLAGAGIPAVLLPNSLFQSTPTRNPPFSAEMEAKEKAAAAAAAAEAAATAEAAEKKAKEEASVKAAAMYADYLEKILQEEDDLSEDRFIATLTSVGIQPYAIGSREAACGIIDRGRKGYITRGDLEHIMLAMGEHLTRAEITDMMRAIDGNPATESRRITYEEMVQTVPPLCPPKKIKAGQTLYKEGQLDPTFYLLMKGTVEFSVRSLQGQAGLQRQSSGASFGEVELLRPDELSTPRLATCTCVGQPSGGGCEVMMVTEHMFDLLTDTFEGVRTSLDLQREVRLTQLAEAVLSKVFQGEEATFGKEDVVWGQDGKETAGEWKKVVPVQGPLPPLWKRKEPKNPPPIPVPPVSRPLRLTLPPRSYSSSSSSSSSSSPAPSCSPEASVDGQSQGRADAAAGEREAMASSGGDGRPPARSGIVNLGSRSVTTYGRAAAANRGSGKPTTEDSHAAAAAAAAASAAVDPVSAAGGDDSNDDGGVDNEGSFVLLVLEGSITAEYGLEGAAKANGLEGAAKANGLEGAAKANGRSWRGAGGHGSRGHGDGRSPNYKAHPRHEMERVLGKGDFLFCGKGFGDGHPLSPKVVSCKPGQTAKVLRDS